jgi:fatty acid desaturase
MRYHALHHYFPGMPYHNFGKGYRRLIANLPPASDRSTDPSLPYSLRELYQKGVAFASQSQPQRQSQSTERCS